MKDVKRIFVIGLSNIGDAILMSPVIERLHACYPSAHLTLLVGERARALFASDPRVHRLLDMDQFAGLMGPLRLVRAVWETRPDLLIDLRQTVLPLVWRPWTFFRYVRLIPRTVTHMRERHLWRLNTQHPAPSTQHQISDGLSLWIAEDDRASVARLVARWGLDASRRLVVACPGARSHIKRWYAEGFARVADRLIEEANVEVVFTGEPDEAPIIQEVLQAMRHRAHNAAGSTTVQQLAALMQRASLVITNDSASLHLACAVQAPTLALFGPTDPRKYGPTGARDRVIQRRLFCVPCEQALCRFAHECMRFISAGEVVDTARQMLAVQSSKRELRTSNFELRSIVPKRILVIRLDRIGDVVLSTPVLQALRGAYPQAFIAMMVRPVCRELVEGHPHLNEAILYDRDGRHHGVVSTIRFALSLRRLRFDTALILHPTNRSHWIPWLAGIPVRIGYDRKCGWLLTHRAGHRKHEGAKHEAEYTLDLVRILGIEPPQPCPVVPIHADADARVKRLLQEQGIGPQDTVVAIHPSASSLSKRWSPDRFAQVADRLITERQARIILVAGPGHAEHAQAVERAMRHRPINLAGQLSVGELACLFTRCRVLLSNDSGPVHVAAAVGIPVVDIFGRNQPGINPARWRALGPDHVVLFKDVGDQASLPPHGEYESPALSALTVEEVYRAVLPFLERRQEPGLAHRESAR